MNRVDIIIVGGGIAGACAGFALSRKRRVAVLERESQPGYHATGRSAASFTENYGNRVVRRLVPASRPFFEEPTRGFSQVPLLRPQGILTLCTPADVDELDVLHETCQRTIPDMQSLSAAEAVRRVPVLRRERIGAALYEPRACDIDVDALFQGYLRGLRSRGGEVVTDAEVTAVERGPDTWIAHTRHGSWQAPILINAAGAWADEFARMAGVPPLGLVPRRRTLFAVDPPANSDSDAWPMVTTHPEVLYFKPDAGRLLACPTDTAPSPPCDVQPDEMDLAVGAARLEEWTTITVQRISARWSGLRTFSPDDSPVVGFDPDAEGFFWLAGLAGYGIKTSPALAVATASLVERGRFAAELAELELEESALSPARFRGIR